MFISDGGVSECGIVSCLHCQHCHCLYSDKDVDYVAISIVNTVIDTV